MLEPMLFVARRSITAAVRRPVVLTFSFVQPMLWMALFGLLFERTVAIGGDIDVDYRTFVAPGIATMTLLFGASQSGTTFVRDIQTGMLGRMVQTPTHVSALLGGKLAGDGLRLAIQMLVVLLCGIAIGADLEVRAIHLPVALVALASLFVLLASISCLLAVLARSPELMGAYVHVVNMPLLFTSSALLPRRSLPEWLGPVAAGNPLTIASESLRALLLDGPPPSHLALGVQCAAALGAFACACAGLHRAGRQP